ncbi:MAG: methyltransferase domain-containing protein [Micromonosporaceae bacterium]|nr:methyltransferase domain-containing protein [Micromonosporaceae bacterium]
MADPNDWYDWHELYEEPGSQLAQRLPVVQERIRLALDEAPAGPLRLLSLVAGQGRDVLPVLAAHRRGRDVTARLVELDPRNTAVARQAAAADNLSTVEVRTADAALIDEYLDLAPADVVLLCGLFGNITDEDIRHTIRHTASLVRRGGTVIWTRHRDAPDLVPTIDDWFAAAGFERIWLSPAGLAFGVGAHRATADPRPPIPGTRLFTFVGRARLATN